MSFEQLGLLPELLEAIRTQGYESPTPIQSKAIPVVLTGEDVLAGAQTGTGKTAAFVLPMLQILNKRRRTSKNPRALVLTPTRELAAQIEDSVRTYGRHLRLYSTVVFGGVGINPQIAKLRKGVDLLVATPGRLLDHVGQRTVDLSEIEILVLDEADRMLDMGFIHDIRKVLRLLPEDRQNLLFSATYSNEIKKLADGLLNNPRVIEVAARNTAAETVAQAIYRVPRSRKRTALSHLIKEGDWHQVLVFTRTKHGANRLARQLTTDGINAAAIHGNKSQSARTRALGDFKSNAIQVLVATDVAARGIDVDQLPRVVNFDLPEVPETYVHRIGRTGRAGTEGKAVSLVSDNERRLLRAIERLLGRSIEVASITGVDLSPKESDLEPPPPPGSHRRSQGNRHGQRRRKNASNDNRPRRQGSNNNSNNSNSNNSNRSSSAGSQKKRSRGPQHSR